MLRGAHGLMGGMESQLRRNPTKEAGGQNKAHCQEPHGGGEDSPAPTLERAHSHPRSPHITDFRLRVTGQSLVGCVRPGRRPGQLLSLEGDDFTK